MTARPDWKAAIKRFTMVMRASVMPAFSNRLATNRNPVTAIKAYWSTPEYNVLIIICMEVPLVRKKIREVRPRQT
jgi:hypothetical protein